MIMETTIKKAHEMNLSDMVHYTDGAIVSVGVLNSAGGSATLYAFDKGQAIGAHTAPFDVLLQVLDGEAEVEVCEKKHRVTKGNAIILPAQEVHAVKAVTAFKMLLTMIK